jgi:hypothetical protein
VTRVSVGSFYTTRLPVRKLRHVGGAKVPPDHRDFLVARWKVGTEERGISGASLDLGVNPLGCIGSGSGGRGGEEHCETVAI